MHVGPRRAAPAQADHVEPDQRPGLAEREAERNNIIAGRRHSGHHHALADPYELMDRDVAAEKGLIADADMAAEHHVVGESDVAADAAIVADMRSDHERTALPHLRDAAAILGTGIHVDALAQFASPADHHSGFATAIMDRLRRRSERGKRVNDGSFANRRRAGDADLGDEAHAALEFDPRSDQTIGSDLD